MKWGSPNLADLQNLPVSGTWKNASVWAPLVIETWEVWDIAWPSFRIGEATLQ